MPVDEQKWVLLHLGPAAQQRLGLGFQQAQALLRHRELALLVLEGLLRQAGKRCHQRLFLQEQVALAPLVVALEPKVLQKLLLLLVAPLVVAVALLLLLLSLGSVTQQVLQRRLWRLHLLVRDLLQQCRQVGEVLQPLLLQRSSLLTPGTQQFQTQGRFRCKTRSFACCRSGLLTMAMQTAMMMTIVELPPIVTALLTRDTTHLKGSMTEEAAVQAAAMDGPQAVRAITWFLLLPRAMTTVAMTTVAMTTATTTTASVQAAGSSAAARALLLIP